jgi:hypothetical protein
MFLSGKVDYNESFIFFKTATRYKKNAEGGKKICSGVQLSYKETDAVTEF